MKRCYNNLLIAITLGVGISSYSIAQADVYFGAQIGMGTPSDDLNKNDTGSGGVFAGITGEVVPFLKLGIEGQLNEFRNNLNLTTDNRDLVIPVALGVAEADFKLVNIAAKAGVAYRSFSFITPLYNDKKWKPVIALSAGYKLMPGTSITFQSTRYFLNEFGKKPFVDSYTLGISYTIPFIF